MFCHGALRHRVDYAHVVFNCWFSLKTNCRQYGCSISLLVGGSLFILSIFGVMCVQNEELRVWWSRSRGGWLASPAGAVGGGCRGGGTTAVARAVCWSR